MGTVVESTLLLPPIHLMAYLQISRLERERIEVFLSEGFLPSEIDQKLQKARGTIGREIQRNSCTGIGYKAEYADYHAHHRRAVANQAMNKIAKDERVRLFVLKKLRARWSPEDISIDLKKQAILPQACPKTIYTFVKKYHPEFLQYFSVLSHKKPRPKGSGKKELLKNRRWIDERPAEVNERKTVGHWEGDTIVSSCRKKAMATFAERMSGYYMAKKMEDRTASTFRSAAVSLFGPLPQEAKKSCTNDNGPEFAEHELMEKELKMTMYFANPYHSWERPINERTNRELRRFFPKGVNFANIEEWELDWAISLINHKPRQRLNNRSPHEVFHELINVAV